MSILAIATLGLFLPGSLPATPADTGQAARPAPGPELLEVVSVYLLPSRFPELARYYEDELRSWGRFEVTELISEADAFVSLDATHKYEVIDVPVDDECADAEADDPLCDRPVATTEVFDAFRVKIFVQGGPTLWEDEVAIEHDDRAAKILVERLRAQIEAEGTS